MILHQYHLAPDSVSRLSGTQAPVMIWGDFTTSTRQPPHWDQVASNNQNGAQLALKHLFELGLRRIGFIEGAQGTPSSLKRLAGYRAAHEEVHLPAADAYALIEAALSVTSVGKALWGNKRSGRAVVRVVIQNANTR